MRAGTPPIPLRESSTTRRFQTGRSSTCFLRPSESLTTPSLRSRSRPIVARSSVTHVVDPQAAALDLPPRLAVRGDQPARTKAARTPSPREFGRRDLDGRQRSASAPSSKVLRAVSAAASAASRAMQQRGRLGGEHLLRLVDLGALQRRQPRDLVQRQQREQLQEPLDVGVLGVAPELPVIVGRAACRRRARPRPPPSCPSWRRTPW